MSAEDRIKLDALRVQYVYVSETRPTDPFEGMLWHKPSMKDNYLFIDGEFHYLSGESMEERLGRLNANMIDLGLEVEIMKRAELRGVDANIYLETLQTMDDIKLSAGMFDESNRRITF